MPVMRTQTLYAKHTYQHTHTHTSTPTTDERTCIRESRRPAVKLHRLRQAKLVTDTLDRRDSQIVETL